MSLKFDLPSGPLRYVLLITIGFWLAAVAFHFICRFFITRAKKTPETYDDVFWQSLKWPVTVMLLVLGPFLGVVVALQPQYPQVFRSLWIGLLSIAVLGAFYVFKQSLVYFKKKTAGGTSPLDHQVLAIVGKTGWIVLFALLVGLVMAFFGLDPTPWLLGVAFVCVLLGYVMRDAVSNLFGGIAISLDSPFQEGDIILLPTKELCRVEHVGWRTTKLYDLLQHATIIVPNSTLASQVIINASQPDPELRVHVDLYVPHDTEIERARGELIAVAQANPEIQRTSVKRLKELAAHLHNPQLSEAIQGVTAGKDSLSREEIAMLQRVALDCEMRGARLDPVKLELAKEPVAFVEFLSSAQDPLIKLTLYVFVRHLERRLDVITDLYQELQKKLKVATRR